MFVKYCVIGRLTTLRANELPLVIATRLNGRDQGVASPRLAGVARRPNLAWLSCGEHSAAVGAAALAPAKIGRGLEPFLD